MNRGFWLGVIIETLGWMFFTCIEGYILFFVATDPWWIKLILMLLMGVVIYVITGSIERKSLKLFNRNSKKTTPAE
jgi:hypothetical protein